jgi:1,2-diacylglycerol 3-alpha-glucosyltransferase
LKIAILIPNFVEADGAARTAEIQAREMAAEGHEITIFALAANMHPEGVTVKVMGMPKNLLWERVYRLLFPLDVPKTLKWLPELKEFDEVIVHLYPLTWLGYLAKRRYGVRYTFWYHGIMPPRLFPHFYERVYMRLQILLTRLTVRNADRAVAVSNFGREELKRYTGLDSEVLYSKPDLAKFRSGIDGAAVREKYNLGDAPLILSVGALRPVKGVHLLIQVFNLLKKEIPDARLVIVGSADYPYYFRQLKRSSDDSVIFTGFIPDEELLLHYAACDIYASCSLWEIQNGSALKAQACGKPIIVWHESFSETIDENGALVEQGNIEGFARACVKKIRQVRGQRGGT